MADGIDPHFKSVAVPLTLDPCTAQPGRARRAGPKSHARDEPEGPWARLIKAGLAGAVG